MIEQIYRPLAELKQIHREERQQELKRAYDQKKAAKRLDKSRKVAKVASSQT